MKFTLRSSTSGFREQHPQQDLGEEESKKGNSSIDYASLPFKEVMKLLSTSIDGLSEKEAERRLEVYGKNTFSTESKVSLLSVFISQFKSILVVILLIATVISGLLGEWIDAIAIFIIVILNAILGTIQEYKAENAIESLKKFISPKIKVRRGGKEKIIDSALLVPGDIIILEEGINVPADARLIEAHNLATMEATLTGESTPIEKDVQPVVTKLISEKKSMVFKGTSVIRGRGLAVVTSTGNYTEMGKIAKKLSEMKRVQTHLEKKLVGFSKSLSLIILAITVFTFLIYRFFDATSTIKAFMIAVSLAVAAIPEGLPAVVTLTLSLGANRMAKKKAIVRRLASIETLGAVTVICTDKTGTLTKNELTVKKIFDGLGDIDVGGTGYTIKGSFSREFSKDITLAGALASRAKLIKKDNEDNDIEVEGDPTEIALVVLAEKAGFDVEKERRKRELIGEVSFSSERKRMSIAWKERDKNVLYSKGAPEVLIQLCTHVKIGSDIQPLTEELKKRFLDKVTEYAKHALRVLAIAYKQLPDEVEEHQLEQEEKDLILLGIVGMIDPPREEVYEAIEKCKKAGIKPIMITGDHLYTAKAIAEEIGIEGKAIRGDEIDSIDLDKEVENIAIYARVNPSHKLKIVEALKKKGHVVAMTGDGVNDAPAIKEADIGIAVGSGTDVAKEAAEMIIIDDNFATIVSAIEEGRGIYRNIKKFINYLLSNNLGEVLVVSLAAIFSFIFSTHAVIFTALQILWVNLLTDGFPALALGVDPAPKNIMENPPRDPKEEIIDKQMAFSLAYIGILIAIAVLVSFFSFIHKDLTEARTVALTTLVFLELVRIASIKKSYNEPLFNNKYLLWAIIGTLIIQLIAIYSPLNKILKLSPISLYHWIFVVGITFLVFLMSISVSKLFSKFNE